MIFHNSSKIDSWRAEGVTIGDSLISRVFVEDGSSGRSVLSGIIEVAVDGCRSPCCDGASEGLIWLSGGREAIGVWIAVGGSKIDAAWHDKVRRSKGIERVALIRRDTSNRKVDRTVMRR